MAQTAKYVCFTCRVVTRGADVVNPYHKGCPRCHRAMIYVGCDFRTPAKSDAQGWKDARKWAERRAAFYRSAAQTGGE